MTPGDESAGRSSARALLFGFASAGASVAVFSGWFVVTRFAVTRELTIWDVTALRFGIGALVLLPVLLKSRLPPRAWGQGLIFALLWGAPFVILVALGLRLTSAAQAASTTPTLMPVFAGVIAWVGLGEWPGRPRLLGYGTIIAGLVVLTRASAPEGGVFDPVGLAALALAAAMWAVYTLMFRVSSLSALQSAALICFWSAVLFVPFYIGSGISRLGQASLQELALQGVYQGVLMSAVAIVTFNRAVAILGPGAATAVIALIPVVATLIAIPVLGEMPGPAAMVAIGVIVCGVVLAARPRPQA